MLTDRANPVGRRNQTKPPCRNRHVFETLVFFRARLSIGIQIYHRNVRFSTRFGHFHTPKVSLHKPKPHRFAPKARRHTPQPDLHQSKPGFLEAKPRRHSDTMQRAVDKPRAHPPKWTSRKPKIRTHAVQGQGQFSVCSATPAFLPQIERR